MSDEPELMTVDHWANRPEPDSLNRVDVWGAEPKEVEYWSKGWRSVDHEPMEGGRVLGVYCCPSTLLFVRATYKDGGYWTSGGTLLDTPSYWRVEDA